MTQMDLALEADVSARHLSFIETGRSTPSARHGQAPGRAARRAAARAQRAAARRRLRARLCAARRSTSPRWARCATRSTGCSTGHEPFPAVVVDRHWGMVAANSAIPLLTAGVAEHLLEPPVNVLRLTLHPEGMAPRIVNLAEWRAHLLDRLGRQAVTSGDPALAALHDELGGAARSGAPSRTRPTWRRARSRRRCGSATATPSCASSAPTRRSAPRST